MIIQLFLFSHSSAAIAQLSFFACTFCSCNRKQLLPSVWPCVRKMANNFGGQLFGMMNRTFLFDKHP